MRNVSLILIPVMLLFVSFEAHSRYADEAERIRAEYMQAIRNKNRPGTVAADFNFVTIDSVAANLHSLPADKNLVVLFYDPECDHCLETINAMKSLHIEDSCGILAVDIAGELETWRSMQSLLPENWISAFATDALEDEEIYVFDEIPALYLLAPDKSVILKDTTLPQIAKYLNLSDF